MFFDGPGAHIGQVFFAIVGGILWIFGMLVAIAIIFLLVRFLLIATRAAQIYVANNAPAAAEPPAATDASAAPATPATPVAAEEAPAAEAAKEPPVTAGPTPPARKPRTPRTPPADSTKS